MNYRKPTTTKLPEPLCALIKRHDEVKRDLVRYVNDPEGKNTITLSTGEKALNADDAWLIIAQENGQPYLRDKRYQWTLDELKTGSHSGNLQARGPQEHELVSSMETNEIISLMIFVNKYSH